MAPDPALLDALLSWVGAIGVFRFLWHTRRDPQRSALERRIGFLLGCLGSLLLVRPFHWLHPGPVLETLTFVPATLLPLAMVLFVEGLLRRHFPFAMKVFVALGTVAFSAANLAGFLRDSRAWDLAFLSFEGATLFAIGVLLVLRDRRSLSPPENRLVDVVSLAVVCALPLCATDFRALFAPPTIRMGALGALIFVYVCARATSRRDRGPVLMRDLARLGARTLVVGAVLFVLAGSDRNLAPACAALAFALVLVLVTWDRLWTLSEQTSERSFLRWLADAETKSLASFLDGLRECPAAEEYVVLRTEDLRGYDAAALAARLHSKGGVVSRTSIRRSFRLHGSVPDEADEALLALLETRGTSHVCLASAEPLVLLLLNHPGLADGTVTELEIALVRKLAALTGTHDVAPARAS